MSLTAQLLAQGAVAEADEVVELAVVRRDESTGGRQSRRLLRRAILEYAKAGHRCEPPPSARALDILLTPTEEDPDASSAKSLAPVIARRLRVQPESPYRELCEYLRLLQLVGHGGQCADIFRAFGRWLRRAPAGEAIDSALCFCAAMSESPEVIEFLLGDESGGEVLRQPAAWLRSITQWLDHQPASAVEARAMTLATSGGCTAMALVFWFDEVSDLPDSDGWDRVNALVTDDAFDGMPDLDALVAMFGIDGENPF